MSSQPTCADLSAFHSGASSWSLLATHLEPFAELKPTGCVGDDRAVTNGTGNPLLFLWDSVFSARGFAQCGRGKPRHQPLLPGKLG